ncbi:MAG: hypothetical protein OXI63_25430 [Candidatus Poribacteria bacterium]|nr:hypothetical protein [Candidatus Poribacteria bacterium]
MMFRYRFTAFILLLAIAPLGCSVNKKEKMLVRKLDAITLTANDLPTMTMGNFPANIPFGGLAKQPSVIDGLLQVWNGTQPEEDLTVRYWLFQSVDAAGKAADQWRRMIASLVIVINGKIEPVYQPEPNAEDVIGDATWRPTNQSDIWFVKNNVLVYITTGGTTVNQLTLTRSVARKIETKINAALNQQ